MKPDSETNECDHDPVPVALAYNVLGHRFQCRNCDQDLIFEIKWSVRSGYGMRIGSDPIVIPLDPEKAK